MEERIPLLRGKVGSEAKGMEKRLHVLSQEWEAGRPLSKEHTPDEVDCCCCIFAFRSLEIMFFNSCLFDRSWRIWNLGRFSTVVDGTKAGTCSATPLFFLFFSS